MRRIVWAVGAALTLVGCGDGSGVSGMDALSKQVERTRVGHASDHWIEMRNLVGEWERTGLIFGYADDYGECMKAIAGLKEANGARDYRCAPAN